MLASKSSLKRRLQIVEMVRKRGEVSVEELSLAFDVSSVTIRSDLTYLEEQRYLVRSFGKARYLAQRADESVLTPLSDFATRKAGEMSVARLASDSVGDFASVMLGAGEIVHKLLPLLSDRANLALLLNDIAMAQTAQRFIHCELQLTGGHLDQNNTVLTGPDAERSVNARSLDLCILEATGLDADGNLLCSDPGLARVFQAAVATATRSIVLAWQPRLSERDGHVFCNLADLDGVVIDDGIDPPTMDLFPNKQLDLYRRENGILEFRRATH